MTALNIWRNSPRRTAQWGWGLGAGDEFDRLFEGITRNLIPFPVEHTRKSYQPVMEVEEGEKSLILSFDLPGLGQEDIKVEIDQGKLSISGERKDEKEEKEENSREFTERRYGSFKREFTLPDNIDFESIVGEFKNGVLNLTLPKVAVPSPRRIVIK